MKSRNLFLALFSLVAMLFSACQGLPPRQVDTANAGSLKIGVDNAVEPIISSQLDIFRYDYPETNPVPVYQAESSIFHHILQDSLRFAITTRKLSSLERAHFSRQKIEVYENRIATNALALVINRSNPDSMIHLSDLSSLLKGKIVRWENLRINTTNSRETPSSSLRYTTLRNTQPFKGPIEVIIDQNGSSTMRLLKEKFGPEAMDSKQIYAVKGNDAVIRYVEKNPGALGITSFNWLRNNDSASDQRMAGIRLVSLTGWVDTATNGRIARYYRPSPGTLYDKTYPLDQPVYSLSVEGHAGLGTGFAVFLISDKGQLIFSKSGVLPARGISREIHFK